MLRKNCPSHSRSPDVTHYRTRETIRRSSRGTRVVAPWRGFRFAHEESVRGDSAQPADCLTAAFVAYDCISRIDCLRLTRSHGSTCLIYAAVRLSIGWLFPHAWLPRRPFWSRSGGNEFYPITESLELFAHETRIFYLSNVISALTKSISIY